MIPCCSCSVFKQCDLDTKDPDTELAAVSLQYYLVAMLFTFHSLCFLAM